MLSSSMARAALVRHTAVVARRPLAAAAVPALTWDPPTFLCPPSFSSSPLLFTVPISLVDVAPSTSPNVVVAAAPFASLSPFSFLLPSAPRAARRALPLDLVVELSRRAPPFARWGRRIPARLSPRRRALLRRAHKTGQVHAVSACRVRNRRYWAASADVRAADMARRRHEEHQAATVVRKEAVLAELRDGGWLTHVFRHCHGRIVAPLLAGRYR